MTADQSRPVPRASAVGSIDREALIELLWDQGAVGEAYHRRDGAEWLADRILALVRPVEGEIDGGRIQAVWAVFCDACNTWLNEWNRSPAEAEVILREHQDELHD